MVLKGLISLQFLLWKKGSSLVSPDFGYFLPRRVYCLERTHF